ncbi:Uncharacterised protein [Vibrio cholerae]|nr:Uncharacterised protein [Vibrio cholerae]
MIIAKLVSVLCDPITKITDVGIHTISACFSALFIPPTHNTQLLSTRFNYNWATRISLT